MLHETQNKAGQQGPRACWILASLAVCAFGFYWFNNHRGAQPAGSPGDGTAASVTSSDETGAQLLSKVRRSDIVQKDGLYFLKDSTTPFTGVMEDFYEGEILKSRCPVKAGRLHGIVEGWYTNGQQQVREQYVMGEREGLQAKWYADGSRQSETHFAAGTFHGLYQRWHENGGLAYRVEMRAGKPDGVSRAYYPSGCLKAEVTSKMGQTIKRQTWKDGELRQTIARNERTQ